MRILLCLACAVILGTETGVVGGQALDAQRRSTRRIMGTFCEVQVYHAEAEVAIRAIAAALDEMQRVERLLSNYDPNSELSLMNRGAATMPFRASEELFAFVKRSRDYFTETAGTFDPTVGPLVRAWGFFSSSPARPTDAAVASAQARSGFDKVRLDGAARMVSYAEPGLEFDPGGIGKGYAVEMAVRTLRRAGITSAMVSAGGSTIYAIGHPPGRKAWRLGIGDPATVERPIRYVLLRDAAVSTSGVSRKSVEDGGHRYSHVFDPRTGQPVEGMCQVSIVTPNPTDSDALTKAAFILGREAVLDLFRARGRTTHVMRVEGACEADRQIWTTPWSADVFVEREG